MSTTLTLTTVDAPARAMNVPLPFDPPAGGWTFPPTSVTLIAGERDAVLVDTLPTVRDTAVLADRIAARGRRLTHVFVTHGHVDHFLGTAPLTARFPGVKVVSTAATAEIVAAEQRTGRDTATWAALFADELVRDVVVPEALPADGRFDLEGHELVAVPAGQSDLTDSSYLWVPTLSAAVVGDIAYDDVHVPLLDTTPEIRRNWIATLRELQHRAPEVVVASHRRAGPLGGGTPLAATADYLEFADALLTAGRRPGLAEFVARLVEAHPTRANVSTAIYGGAALGLR